MSRRYFNLTTAPHLARKSIGVIVLEAREPGWGGSGCDGGQVIPDAEYDPAMQHEVDHVWRMTFSAHLRKCRTSGLSESRRQQTATSIASSASRNGLKTTPVGHSSSAQAGRIARPSPAKTRLSAEWTVSTRLTTGMLT